MAVQGRFDADFSSFYAACQRAEVELKAFDAGARQVEQSLDRMVDNFTGRKIISEATLMSEAVSRVGGPSRLTAAELARVGDTAAEAAAKFRAWGQDVPPAIQRIVDAQQRARVGSEGLRDSFRQVDGMLQTLGINIGPEVKGLEQLVGATGKTVGQFGLLATAGAVLATALASLKLGRLAAEALDADEKIANLTAKAMGWGDVAGQRAAAGAEALARATKEAGFQVTQMSTAVAVNEAKALEAIAANQKLNDSFVRLTAPQKAAEDFARWTGEIAKLKSQGLLDALTADINSHAFSMATLAERYRTSTEALSIFAKTAAEVARIEDSNSKKMAALRLDSLKADAERQAAALKASADATKAMYAEIEATTAATEKAHEMGIAFDEAQRLAKQRTDDETKALEKQKKAADAVGKAIVSTITYDLSTPEGMAQFKRLNPAAAINTPDKYFDTHTLQDAIQAGLVNLYAGFSANTRTSGSPIGNIGGSAPAVVNPTAVNVNVSGILDARTIDELTTKVGAAIALRTGMKVGI